MPLGDLVQCDFCDEALNLSFCNQCSVRLCVQCKEKHESLVDCKEKVVAYSSRLYPNVKWCKFHKNEEESIALCKTCTVPLCSTCLEMHEDHDHFKQLKDVACNQPTDQSSQICCSRQCPAGKQPGPVVRSPRGGSARRSTYKDATFESRNKCKEKVNSTYEASMNAGSGEEYETRNHVPQTDREERLTSATCLGKLNYWLHVLKQSVEKLNELYNNERIHPSQPPKEQKHQQIRTKFQTKKSSTPMSAVSEEIIHLRENVEILEKVTQLSSYVDPAKDVHLWERLKAFKSELILEDQIIEELKIMQNTEKQLTETWNKKVESLQTKNEQLNHEKKDCEAEIKKLEKLCGEQKEEINLKTGELRQLNAEIKKMKSGNERQKKQLEIVHRQLVEKERELKRYINEKGNCQKQLKDELKKKEMEISQMKIECEDLKAECRDFSQQLKDRDIELKALKEESNDLKSDYRRLKKEYCSADKRLKEEQEKRQSLAFHEERRKESFENFEKELFEKKEENNRLRKELLNKESVERKMLEKIEDQMRKNTELELELSKLSREMQQKEQLEKANELYCLQREKITLSNEVGLLNDSLQKLQLEMEITLKENQAVKKETEEMEYALQSKEKYIREISNERKRLKTEIRIMKEEINNDGKSKQMLSDHLRLQIENTQKDLLNTKDKLNSWQKKYKQIEEEKRDADNRRSEFEKAFTTLEEENMVLKDQIARLREETAYTRKDTEKINIALEVEKEDQIRKLQHQISKLNKSEQYLKLVVTKHQEDYNTVKEEQIRDNKMLLEKERENSILKQELCRKIQELKEIKQRRKDDQTNTQEKILETSNEKSRAESRQRKLESTVLSKDKEIAYLTNQLEESKEMTSVMEREMKELEANLSQDLEKLNKKNNSLHGQIVDLKSRLKETEEKFEQSKKDKLNTEQQYWLIEKAIQEKDLLIANLKKQLERTETEYKELLKDTEVVRKRTSSNEVEIRRKENNISSLQSQLSEANELIEKIKQEENKWKEICSKQSNMLKEKEKDIVEAQRRLSSLEEYKMGYETMRTEKEKALKRYLELSRDVENKERDFENLKHQLSVNLQRAEDLTKECHDLRRDNQNMERKILRMTKAIQEKEKELESQAEQLASSEENVASMSNEITRIQQTKQHDAEESARRLLKENNALKLDLEKVNSEAQQKISVLNNEIKDLRRSQGYDSEEKIKKLNRENISLKSELERITARLSSVAGEKLRDNNPGIADLSDENRPINLGEKFSQLYNDQWTDAKGNLDENLGVGETEGIQCLLSILKRVFDECVRVSDDQFTQLKEITGTTDVPNDQLKKLKNLRKSTALKSVKSVKQLVNKVMSSVFSKEKDACQSYIDRCTELCWLMCVQDPPVVIDFTAVRGQVIDDKMLRKFAKTGSKIDFLVWPMIRLHKNGPLLQKGVVQPL